ncbi:MAG: hypothetical protein ABWY00_09280, partial [Dongiaceae bacterium]
IMPLSKTAVPEAALPSSASAHLVPPLHPLQEVHCFSLRADLEPGLLPRLLEAFAKRGIWPTKFYSQTVARDEPGRIDEAMIDIQVAGLDCATRDHIAMQFRGMVGIQSVLISVKAS